MFKRKPKREDELLRKYGEEKRQEELNDIIFAYKILDENYLRFKKRWD